MHAEIVMIGTELLLGEIVDTNANKLARALRDIGLDLYYKTTVGDNETRITEVLESALERSDVVITSGGLGPTVDDVTRKAVANATGRKLAYSIELEGQIAERFRSFGKKMAENNKRQAYIPEGALPLTNPVGTAPCFLSEDVRGRGFIVSLPGVPRELDYMLKHVVIPLVIERVGGEKITQIRILRTCAVGESNVDRAIGDLMTNRNPTVGLAAHSGQTDVRITAKADSTEEAEELIDRMETEIRKRLGVAIYGVEAQTLAEVVGALIENWNLKLGLLDALTNGELSEEMAQAGLGNLIVTNVIAAGLNEAIDLAGLERDPEALATDNATLSSMLAKSVTPRAGIGLALVGPFEERSTIIALYGPGERSWVQPGRNFQDTPYVRHWIAIQGLDCVRRFLLGQYRSPVD
jgi:nicotinamide-nucleotide amidase